MLGVDVVSRSINWHESSPTDSVNFVRSECCPGPPSLGPMRRSVQVDLCSLKGAVDKAQVGLSLVVV